MLTPEISIIMPLYNAAPYVRESVESILAQSFPHFELLVVDDGSSDEGPEQVRAFTDERIRLIPGQANRGPAAARNRGLSEIRGQCIVFFDSDDLAVAGMLGALWDCMISQPESDMVAGWYEGIDEAGQLNGKDFKKVIPPEKIAPSMLFRNCIPTPGLLMKRECLEKQSFDETLEIASDFDMWSRLVVARRARQLPRVLARYRSHPGNVSHRKKSVVGDCLQRIYRRQLTRLGIEAGADDTHLHAQLGQLTFGTPKEIVLAAEQWLLKLDVANRETGLYSTQPFQETLGDQWFAVCHSAGCNGFWTWRRFFASPLSKWITLTAKQRYGLLRLTARGALKNSLA